MTQTPVLQFGTSRFLQAHADLFISQAGAGPVTVVQSSGDLSRAHRLQALTSGFPVRIRGLSQGQKIDREERVTSITRALSTTTDWHKITRIATEEARFILSNTGDRGYAPDPADMEPTPRQEMSYPAKLMHLLLARFRAGAGPIQIMPMELVAHNGTVLRDRVLEIAAPQDAAFRAHLRDDILWVTSLVDRIVSEAIEPAGAVAEPYALWAIEDQPGLTLPCIHPCVQVVPDLTAIETLKLHILNLGHTVLADRWLAQGMPEGRLVRDAMADPAERAALLALYEAEVLPAFDATGMGPQARAYLAITLDRFANPFLNHRLSDIAQNHREKITRRITAFLDRTPTGIAQPQLRAIAAGAA